ncbi:MAG: CPBP family intramembrane metalloprotease [Merismopedia sp. SIO2A8]|nr:CPBP family intramembrane metalloprotease [Symploca sp. SIO2B6]NET50344.1 CPBP family intramembrane metalloprotease [Merismopedia sp. SIO2A8]
MTYPSSPEPSSTFQRWGLWATVGWSLCIALVFIMSQTLVLLGVMWTTMAQNPGLDPVILAQRLETDGGVLSLATLLSNPLCVGLVALVIRWRQGFTVKRYLELHWPNWRSLFLWCGITLALIHGIDFLKAFIDRAPSSFTTDIYQSAQSLPLLYLAVAVAAPLFEEVFFRGFMFQGLRSSFFGDWGAVIVSSGLWAVIHLQYDVYDVTGIFIFGLVLALAQIRTRSLYIPIAMHALNNALALSQVALS